MVRTRTSGLSHKRDPAPSVWISKCTSSRAHRLLFGLTPPNVTGGIHWKPFRPARTDRSPSSSKMSVLLSWA